MSRFTDTPMRPIRREYRCSECDSDNLSDGFVLSGTYRYKCEDCGAEVRTEHPNGSILFVPLKTTQPAGDTNESVQG